MNKNQNNQKKQWKWKWKIGQKNGFFIITIPGEEKIKQWTKNNL